MFHHVSLEIPWSSSSNFRTNRQPPFLQLQDCMETHWRRLAWWLTTHVLRAIGRTQGGTTQGWKWNWRIAAGVSRVQMKWQRPYVCLYNHLFFLLKVFKHLKIFGEFGKAHLEWFMGLQTYTGTKQALNAQIDLTKNRDAPVNKHSHGKSTILMVFRRKHWDFWWRLC